MKKNERPPVKLIHIFSQEKIDEFKSMSVRMKLRWLEEANAFVNKVVSLEKRAWFDPRFKDLSEKVKVKSQKKTRKATKN